MNIYGQPKAGKSRLALGLVEAISQGRDMWMDRFPIRKPGAVLWLEADNSASEWWNVVKAAEAEGYDLSNVHFIDRRQLPFPFDLLNEELNHAALLKEAVEQFIEEWGEPPVLIVVDTLRRVHSGDEDKSYVVQKVLDALQSAAHPSALLLISHSRKGYGFEVQGNKMSEEQAEGSVMNEQRGSNALVGAVQTIIRVTVARNRSHGWFTAEGRDIDHIRFRMKQIAPSYLWQVDLDPAVELSRELREQNPEWSIRKIAKEVAQVMKLSEEKSRSIVRRALNEPKA